MSSHFTFTKQNKIIEKTMDTILGKALLIQFELQLEDIANHSVIDL